MNEEEIVNQDTLNTDGTAVAPQDDTNDEFVPQELDESDSLEEQNRKLAENNRRLYARLQKVKEKKPEAEKPKESEPEKPKSKDANEELDRLRLEARGYLNEDEQDIILKFSKGLGISPVQAANDELVKAKIERMRQEQKTENAIPSPSGKGGSQKHDVNYYIEKGELPDDSEMFEKVQTELVRRSKNNLNITNPNDLG